MKTTFSKSSIAALAACAILSGCGGSSGGGSSNAQVFYANSVPDSTAMDFSLNASNVPQAQSLAWGGKTSKNFLSTVSGSDDVAIIENGGAQELDNEAETFTSKLNYAVVAVGEEGFAANEVDKRPQVMVATVDKTSAITGSFARLVVVNGLVRQLGYDNIAIDFSNPGNTPTFDLQNIAYATGQSFNVASGSEDFQVKHSGTDQVFAEKTLTLTAGHVYLILATGIENPTNPTAANIPTILQYDLGTPSQ